ncbi:hypothetical protein Taro_019266 [Colocasia esculenta]|uniref:Uncharacterized protein n=1 Tax=Colocasia esculenta TaxID=4460 RepID=A0A843UKM6_COLES|nr:hypothetical protein [Colocasia esculenta]
MKNLGLGFKNEELRFEGSKLEILIRLASDFFQHGQGDDCDLWKLTEFNSDSRFELDTQIYIKQVLEDSSSTRLLPLGRLRSRKKRTHSLHHCLPRRRLLSRPHTPCVRLEHSFEGLRKSPLTVDSHTTIGLDVAFYTTQDYEESLPHDLLEESTRP